MNNPLMDKDIPFKKTKIAEDHAVAPLSQCVSEALQDYFEQLEGLPPSNLYEMLMTEVEVPLLKATLAFTDGNQSRAAEILGINRGTLRKKLKHYDL